MSVQGYLQLRANDAVLTSAEKESITRSITALESKLRGWFGSQMSECFQFGSSTRGTVLPRSMDDRSDVDYMVVFSDRGLQPQTHLTQLRAFAEHHYQRTEIFQSHPTMVLEMNHIRFELVPAVKPWPFTQYRIPALSSGYTGWASTDPIGYLSDLDKKNQNLNYLLKPVIRLVKYWNAWNGKVFPSFELEKTIADGTALFSLFGPKNIKDIFYRAIEQLNTPYGLALWRQDAVTRAKAIVRSTKLLEASGRGDEAERAIQRLIP